MFKVIMFNSGGELDSVTVETEEKAHAALRKMVDEIGSVCDGDTFTIVEDEQ